MKRNKRGQTIIEFAMVSMLFVFMLVLTFNAILAFCTHEYISYAVFMTARAFQASAANSDAQYANARMTFANFFPGMSASQVGQGAMNYELRFDAFSTKKALARITSVSFPPLGSNEAGTAGFRVPRQIVVSFDVPFAELPLGAAAAKSFARLPLRASSGLGREPTQEECWSFFRGRYGNVLKGLSEANAPGLSAAGSETQNLWVNMEDNGC